MDFGSSRSGRPSGRWFFLREGRFSFRVRKDICDLSEWNRAMREDRERLRAELRIWGRRALQEIWLRHERGERMPTVEARLARILAEHPEYARAWEPGTEVPDGDFRIGEVNPFLHVQVHLMVESQISEGNPREVSEAVERLQHRGRSRHEAIHAVGKVLTLELHGAIRDKRPFDSGAYVQALSGILAEPPGGGRSA